MGSITAIVNLDVYHPYVYSILEKCTRLAGRGQLLIFIWCPSHIGISGNETADSLAKQALALSITQLPVPYTDLKPYIKSFIKSKWQRDWDGCIENKLHAIQPLLGVWPGGSRASRREEIVLTRLRLGHTYLTHKHLLSGDPAPLCIPCDELLTVKHILVDCIDFQITRSRFYTVDGLEELFRDVRTDLILNFVHAIGLFYRI